MSILSCLFSKKPKESNIYQEKEFNTKLLGVCKDVISVLRNHCGPKSRSALIFKRQKHELSNMKYANIFTNDGINIVDEFVYKDSLKNHLKNTIAFIGDRVDRVSHDGTTTSMLLGSLFIRNCLKNKVAYNKDTVDQLFKYIYNSLENNKITIQDLIDEFQVTEPAARSFVAFNQAMISSKGNRELADAIVQIIQSLPAELYSQFDRGMATTETDKVYSVRTQSYDFSIVVTPMIFGYENNNLDTEYRNEHCDVLVCDDKLIEGGHEASVVRSYLESCLETERERDLIILAPDIAPSFITLCSAYNMKHTTKIYLFTRAVSDTFKRVTQFSAINAYAGVYNLSENIVRNESITASIIKDVDVRIDPSKILFLSRLYERTGQMYHPFYEDKEKFLPYTQIVGEIKTFLDSYSSGKQRFESHNERVLYSEYVDLYKTMLCQKVVYLEIGGSTHDGNQAIAVAKDALGAVIASIEHGFVLDAFSTLYTHLTYETRYGRDFPLTPTVKEFMGSISEILNISHGTKNKQFILPNTRSKYAFYIQWDDYKDTEKPRTLDKIVIHTDNLIHIQPFRSQMELFKRFHEVVPKILDTVTCVACPDMME